MSEVNCNTAHPEKIQVYVLWGEDADSQKTLSNLPSFFLSWRTIINFKTEAMILSLFLVFVVLLTYHIL